MPLNAFDKKMIAKNKINLQPTINFVSASAGCRNISLHELENHGIYGELDSRNNKINSSSTDLPRIFNIKKRLNNLENKKTVEILNIVKDDSEFVNIEEKEDGFNTYGIFFDKSGDYKFKVKRLQQSFLVEDPVYAKKQSIKNIYKYYNENIESRYFNLNWGFSNYNTINFFNIDESLNSEFSNYKNLTHKNCLAYPNALYSGDKKVYDFDIRETNGLTFSFYINPNKKNTEGYHFNPGCILYIPHIISINIVKGSSTDINGLTDKFRLFIELGNSTLGRFNNADDSVSLNSTIKNTDKDVLNSTLFNKYVSILSKDNILNYNEWQNVSLVVEKRSKNSSDISLYINGEVIEKYTNIAFDLTIDSDLKGSNQNTFILVGNRIKTLSGINNLGASNNSNHIEDFYKKLFSTSKNNDEDNLGPYINKFISLGKSENNNIQLSLQSPNSSLDYDFNNQLNISTGDYIDGNTSLALNAEIHDIRIYNTVIENIKEVITENSVLDFSEPSLIFTLPVYYREVDVKRKSLVNLNGLDDSNNNVNTINDNNLLIENVVNYYFSNKCLGHEVSIENFLFEFKNKTSPNIILGGEYEDESNLRNTWNIVAYNKDFNSVNESINLKIKKGESLNSIYDNEFLNIDFENTVTDDFKKSYFLNNLNYRNCMILPNDNGIQKQHFDTIKNYYENYNGYIHYDDNDNLNLSLISVKKIFSEDKIWKNNLPVQTISGNTDLINRTEDNELVDLDERKSFSLGAGSGFNTFKESYNLFKNTSLYNYHNSGFKLDSSYDSNRMLFRNEFFTNRANFEIGNEEFFKDFSNPLGRKIHDNYNNAVNNSQIIGEKEIDNDNTPDTVGYLAHEMPLYNLRNDLSENYSVVFDISSQMYRKRIEKNTFELFDVDFGNSGGALNIKIKDNGLGGLYRASCLTKHATWNTVGNCLYREGFASIVHPSLESFGRNNFSCKFKAQFQLNVMELNLPAYSGRTNKSRNTSYIEDLRIDSSAFNSDEDFVFITDINLHDDDLNIIGTAKLANPFPKKSSDNVVFRLKMDF